MSFAALSDRLARVQEDIASVREREGITNPVRIVAVTKGHAVETARMAAAAGLTELGENRVQEALEKQEVLASLPVTWHLIGHLQTNKAKLVPGRFGMVHSVDSERLVAALDAAVGRLGAPPLPVLVQVNVAGEAQKSGCAPHDVDAIVSRIDGADGLSLEGLMTMAPFTDDEGVQRRTFAALRSIRDRVATPERPLAELSMGMSGDYRAAVAEGATLLRLGTVLFGERSS